MPLIVIMFLFLPHCTLDNFAIGKHVNYGDEYGIKTPQDFNFYTAEKALNWLKTKITKIEEKLNETVKKYCLKLNAYKLLTRNDLLLGMSTKESISVRRYCELGLKTDVHYRGFLV